MRNTALECHWQAGEATQYGIVVPDQLLRFTRQVQMRQTLEQGTKSDLPLQTRQRCTQADMDTLAKGEMFIHLARNIQRFWISKLLCISIGRD